MQRLFPQGARCLARRLAPCVLARSSIGSGRLSFTQQRRVRLPYGLLIADRVVIVTAADLTFNQGVRVRLPPTLLRSDARLEKGAVCKTVVFGLCRFDSYSDHSSGVA